jgi:hypothetical protein
MVTVALFGACHPAASGPEATLREYQRAVRAGRFDRAYALMSQDYRSAHDRAAFERSLTRERSPTPAAAFRVRAEARLADGSTLPLVLEDGAWRLDRDPLDFYTQSTPDEALRSFIRAVDQRRYDVLVRFVPTRYRAVFTADKLRDRWDGDAGAPLRQQLEVVRAHLETPLEIDGERARLPLGPRKEARLVREGVDWKVEAIE